MNKTNGILLFILGGVAAMATDAAAQPHIGFVYPAGAQRGTTTQVRLGGQRLDGVHGALVSGSGVEAKIVEYRWMLTPQEVRLMREQRRQLQSALKRKDGEAQPDPVTRKILAGIENRLDAHVFRPANRSIANLVLVEVTVAPDAEVGPREIRLVTLRGVTNPMAFHVGQYPEVARKPMNTAPFPVLGNEEAAERKRPPEEVEERVEVPCVVNGQVAAGEVNRYRFQATKGRRLVVSVQARALIPYIADAVPGWFQPVIALYNAGGREVAYADVFRFQPDPVLHYEVPDDGEYVLTISDALFRGREDFVYRVRIAEQPFITHIFPLGGAVGEDVSVELSGWHLEGARPAMPPTDASPGVYFVTASRDGLVSNRVPFALDDLPECFEVEPNDDTARAQAVELPVIVNGRIDRPGDWDVFRFEGRAGQVVVAEVMARRLDSPLDSVLKLTDADGNLLAANDDYDDPGAGLNTHHADSYLVVALPDDGTYYVHLGDATFKGGEEYGYRLRLSAPRPDFELRAVPSSIAIPQGRAAAISVYVIRRDGFEGPVRLGLKDPPEGISSSTPTLGGDQEMVRLTLRAQEAAVNGPFALRVEGRATIGEDQVVREAVPADDHMQAFLWRHLVPAGELVVRVFDPSYQPAPLRAPPPVPEKVLAAARKAAEEAGQPMFTRQEVARRLRQLDALYEHWLLNDEFYHAKVAECQVAE